MVALQVQGFCLILAIFPAPIIPRIGFYGLKYKAFSIIQDTLIILIWIPGLRYMSPPGMS